MVDVGGAIGWAPASFLVPVDEGDMQDEAEENEQLVGEEKGMIYLKYEYTYIPHGFTVNER